MRKSAGFIALAFAALLLASACGGEGPSAPTGERIAFQATVGDYENGNFDIYVMNADGSGQTNLTQNPARDWEPAWSPDGSRIAFESYRDVESTPDIHVMNADGSGQANLTKGPGGDWHPAWSPDGSRIAFTSRRDGHAEVYVMDADGSNVTRLTHDGAIQAAWSPDGSRIAFVSDRDLNNAIYVINADGSGLTRLTDDASGDPAWSPDGSRIAFVSDRDGNSEIYTMNADGSNVTRLTDSPASDDWPAWSPDGTRIAFVSGRDDDPLYVMNAADIYVMNADGSGQTNLTKRPAGDPTKGVGVDVDPTWSPDGSRIAFVSDRDLNNAIYVINADGSGLTRLTTRLTTSLAIDANPAWSPAP